MKEEYIMKLNENTLTVLKNFASINSGLVIRKGKIQRTISPDETVLAEASLEDDFPEIFGIYELTNFLGNVTTLSNPDMSFSDKSVVLKDGDLELNYFSCSTNLITSPPEGKELVMSDPTATFTITNSNLQKILRLSAMNELTHLSIIGKDGKISLRANELKNDTSNSVSIEVGEYKGDDFKASLKVDNIKVIPDDYTVHIKVGRFTYWVNKNNTLKYFIAFEKDKK
jgi:hypothetical protein